MFSAEAFIEFKRYISGLIVSENKTVDGINRLFVIESRNQSSLNRLLTASPFSLEALNQARLRVLASLPGTQMKAKGVLSVDDTLLTHYGQHFEQIAKLYDPVSESYVWAHDLVTVHYSDDDTDYPVLFQTVEAGGLGAARTRLRAAQIPLKASKEALKESDPAKWRSYLLGVWQRRQKRHPELMRCTTANCSSRRSCCSGGWRRIPIEAAGDLRQLVHPAGLLSLPGSDAAPGLRRHLGRAR